MRTALLVCSLSIALWLTLGTTALALAQFASGGADQQDLPVDAATRKAVLDTLAQRLDAHYVFAARGREYGKALQNRAKQGRYDRITSSKAFADTITAQLQELGHDRHLRLHYRFDPLPKNDNERSPDSTERAKELEFWRARNFGFEKLQRLAGNIGYVELRAFSGLTEAMPTGIAAMNFLANCDAVIFDLRRNGGGSPDMIDLLLTYFTPPGEQRLLNRFYQRDGDRMKDFSTFAYVPGPRLAGKLVYVLTSGGTGSAAEEFAYNVQTHKYGKTVGQVSAGAAHPGGLFRLNEHFAAFIATGRAVSPVTNTNWEGVGVRPDIETPIADAIKTAHVDALNTLIANAADPERKAMLGRALQAAKDAPPDPIDDPRATRKPSGVAPRQ